MLFRVFFFNFFMVVADFFVPLRAKIAEKRKNRSQEA